MLGPLQVHGGDGRPIEVGGARLRLLLTRLALDPGQVVTADRLVEDLWIDDPPADPGGALQTLVARLRRALGAERAAIASHPAGYLLDVAREDVDVRAFERPAEYGRTALEAGDPESAATVLRAGLDLWRGTPFADAGAPPCSPPPRRAARGESPRDDRGPDRRRPRPGHAGRGRRGRGTGARAPSARTAARPAGSDAVRRGPACRGAGDLRTGPARAGRPARSRPGGRAPGGAPYRGRRGGLPARATSFVGRDTELTGVRKALDESRLVTITGFGGAGKTRLALEAASGRSQAVRLVELGSVADPARVIPAVVATVGGDGVFGTDADAGLAEHLLAAAPDVAILATSREPPAIAGETLFPLSPLGLPAPGTDPRTAPAVALFADGAAAVRPGFGVTEEVARVCRALDGIPLAIELAAARLRSLTLGQLTERISDRFGLLERGSRTAEPRHRTLRAVVDWSWDLLGDAGRSCCAACPSSSAAPPSRP